MLSYYHHHAPYAAPVQDPESLPLTAYTAYPDEASAKYFLQQKVSDPDYGYTDFFL